MFTIQFHSPLANCFASGWASLAFFGRGSRRHAASSLKNTAKAKRIASDAAGRRTVIDVPFAETKEVIAGFS